jgi:hypothetical protein
MINIEKINNDNNLNMERVLFLEFASFIGSKLIGKEKKFRNQTSMTKLLEPMKISPVHSARIWRNTFFPGPHSSTPWSVDPRGRCSSQACHLDTSLYQRHVVHEDGPNLPVTIVHHRDSVQSKRKEKQSTRTPRKKQSSHHGGSRIPQRPGPQRTVLVAGDAGSP